MKITDWIDKAYRRDIDKFPNGETSEWIYKAGALAAVEKLQAMGVGEFDAEDRASHEMFEAMLHDTYGSMFAKGARWQHSQTSALLAARDEEIARLKSELSKQEALLHEMNEQLDDKNWPEVKYNLRLEKAEALLRELDESYIDDKVLRLEVREYFSEQTKGGDHVE